MKVTITLLKFWEDCFPNATERQAGWYRKACTDPIWNELRNCSTFEWKSDSMDTLTTKKTTGCNGAWGSEHVEKDSILDGTCNAKYDCTDRSDEAGCEEIKVPTTNFRIYNCLIG